MHFITLDRAKKGLFCRILNHVKGLCFFNVWYKIATYYLKP
nr:MAG TPA_asm: hypothetical protein [Caudoviricetes sp.]